MKKTICLFITSIFTLTVLPAGASEPFALVELYTSQGCSSCPPADTFLRQLSGEAREQKRRVFPLSFHVDYWNRLGWEDPYSSPDFTLRQNFYARAFNKTSVYTPQMIINGKHEFSGFKQDTARDFINEELSLPDGKVSLNFKTEYVDKSTLRITFSVKPLLKDGIISVAVAERSLGNKVPKGENAGKFLSHENVVRAFKAQNLNMPDGQVEITMPDGVNLDASSAVVFIQHAGTMRVLAAEMADLRTPEAFKN